MALSAALRLVRQTCVMGVAAAVVGGVALLAAPATDAVPAATGPAASGGMEAGPGISLAASVTPLAPSDRYHNGFRCEWRDGWYEGGHHHDRDYGYWDHGHRWHHGC
jgi:hypothetical protein